MKEFPEAMKAGVLIVTLVGLHVCTDLINEITAQLLFFSECKSVLIQTENYEGYTAAGLYISKLRKRGILKKLVNICEHTISKVFKSFVNTTSLKS